MSTFLVPSRERTNAMHKPIWIYNFSDEVFIDKFNGEYYKIDPGKKMNLPAHIVWNWVGDPDLRKDEKLWFRELNRLKSRRGEGTAFFDKWLAGRKLVVPDMGNHVEGYYGIISHHKEKVNEGSVPITADELENRFTLPAMSPLTNISDEEVLNFFDGMVSTAPKGSVGGIGGSEASDISRSDTVSTGIINLLSDN